MCGTTLTAIRQKSWHNKIREDVSSAQWLTQDCLSAMNIRSAQNGATS